MVQRPRGENSPMPGMDVKSNDSTGDRDHRSDITCVDDWSSSEVKCWLEHCGFSEYVDLICNVQKIDGKALLMLTEADLRNPPLSIQVLGDIKRIYAEVHKLQLANTSALYRLGVISEPVASLHNFGSTEHGQNCHRRCSSCDSQTSDFFSSHNHGCHENCHENFHQPRDSTLNVKLEPEFWKTLVSMGYFFLVTWITAIVMVIVHDRVPDMEKYPPLPDIFLDNVPFIPWAFDMCEITGCVLFMMWLTILVFHKHRCILLRRMFALLGSVFLLRCVTMLITSLSVPGRHLDCRARPLVSDWILSMQPYGDFWAKLYQAFSIWKGAGMAIQGVRTCGDYMFSGHTVILTMLNFCITEYTPRNMYYVHTFSWVLNLFGIFFILAAHEHYSIDVFIAFYISTRLFLYYHTLANNRDLMQRDSKRTRIWFPLFCFFEARVGGIVPNEFESPMDSINKFGRKLKSSLKKLKIVKFD